MLNFYQYSAFGETVTAEESIPNRLRYNAQTEDELTGLYYLRARYYAPNIGRFTQEDVIYNDGLNLYAYCDSNPVMYGDWTGFSKEPVPFSMGEYYYPDINDIDYNKVLRGYIGTPPVDMYDPHAHHIVFKLGKGEKQRKLVQEIQEILVEVGIDPIKGQEVLCWAPNRVKGQHSYATLKKTANAIKTAYENGEGYEGVVKALDASKKEAAARKKTVTSCSKK